jgi:hypothetical protein
MTKKNTIKRFDASMKDKIKDLIKDIGNDGHTIWKPIIIKAFPEAIQSRFIRTIKSDTPDYKSTVFDKKGNIIEEMEGIYGLNLLGTICSDLNLEYEHKLGRGFQARCYTESIENWLKTV